MELVRLLLTLIFGIALGWYLCLKELAAVEAELSELKDQLRKKL